MSSNLHQPVSVDNLPDPQPCAVFSNYAEVDASAELVAIFMAGW